eukprot:905-Heterococcus_DN1.PRE.1
MMCDAMEMCTICNAACMCILSILSETHSSAIACSTVLGSTAYVGLAVRPSTRGRTSKGVFAIASATAV